MQTSAKPLRSRTRRWSAHAVGGVVSLLVATTACGAGTGPGQSGNDERLRVVATTSILGDIVGEIVGDVGRVDVLMPPGTDPHSFEPSAAQARLIRDADLVVANGLALEERLVDVLEAAESEGAHVFHVAPNLDPRPFGHGHDHAGDSELDPHVWLDPVRMADGVPVIAAQVGDAATDDEERIRSNAQSYRQRLLTLHDDIDGMLDPVPPRRRKLVTNHDAFGYFAARYGFEIVGTVVPGGTTLGEASSRELARLVETIEQTGVPAVFVESTAPTRLARVVSAEIEGRDVEVVPLYSGSLGEEGSGADTYVGMMTTNAQRIAAALAP